MALLVSFASPVSCFRAHKPEKRQITEYRPRRIAFVSTWFSPISLSHFRIFETNLFQLIEQRFITNPQLLRCTLAIPSRSRQRLHNQLPFRLPRRSAGRRFQRIASRSVNLAPSRLQNRSREFHSS